MLQLLLLLLLLLLWWRELVTVVVNIRRVVIVAVERVGIVAALLLLLHVLHVLVLWRLQWQARCGRHAGRLVCVNIGRVAAYRCRAARVLAGCCGLR